MPVYTYSALNERGKATKGVINADSPRAARGKLRQAGLFATDLLETAEAESYGGSRNLSGFSLLQRVRPQDLTVMTRQFATLMAANLTVVEALTALIEQTENRLLQKTLIQVRESINEGSSLAAALEQHPRIFSALFVNMARAGETSGTLPVVMLWLADLTERQLDTRNQITAKMYYPLFMLVIGGLVLMALLAYVVPTVTQIFSHMSAHAAAADTHPHRGQRLPQRLLVGDGAWPLSARFWPSNATGVRRVARGVSTSGRSAPPLVRQAGAAHGHVALHAHPGHAAAQRHPAARFPGNRPRRGQQRGAVGRHPARPKRKSARAPPSPRRYRPAAISRRWCRT